MAVSGGACKRAGALSHKAVERLRLGNIDGTRERILCPVLFNIRWTDIATCNGGGTGCSTNFHRKLCQLPAADRFHLKASGCQLSGAASNSSTRKRLRLQSHRGLLDFSGSSKHGTHPAKRWPAAMLRQRARCATTAMKEPRLVPGFPWLNSPDVGGGWELPGEVHVPQ